MGFNSEQRIPSEQKEIRRPPEIIVRRAQRLSDYVNNIENAQQDFYLKQEGRPLSFDDRNLAKGAHAALCTLAGAGAAGWSFLKHGEYGVWGHSIAAAGTFFGMQLFGHKGMEFVQHFLRVPPVTLDTWREKKKIPLRDRAHGNEGKISEHGLRGKMLMHQLELQEIYARITVSVREYREEKERISERAHIDLQPQPERELEYEQLRFLRKRLHYIDQLIAKQDILLGTMRDYHDLFRFHEEKRSWAPLGFASATALLSGMHASAELDMHALRDTGGKITNLFLTLFQIKGARGASMDFQTSASLAPTFMALLMGWYVKYLEHASEHERNVDASKTLERIEEEIRGIKTYQMGLARRLSRLRQKLGLEITDEIEKTLKESAYHGEDTPYEQWQKKFEEAVGSQFSHSPRSSVQKQSVTDQEESRIMPTLNELFSQAYGGSVSPPPVEQHYVFSQRQHSETGLRAIKPLPAEQIVHSRKQTVVKQVIADVLRIAGKEFDARTQKLVEHMPLQDVLDTILPSTFNAIANDSTVSEEALDEVVRYFGDLDTNMTKSVADFVFPHEEDVRSLRDVQSIISHLDKGKKIRQALERRQIEEIRHTLQEAPSVMRRFFLKRYHVIDSEHDEEVTQAFFEESIRIWTRTANRHDRTSMRKFMDICNQELTPMSVSAKQEKQHCVYQIIRILDSLDAENPFIDVSKFATLKRESLAEMRKRALTPIVDAFRELYTHPKFSKEFKIQDIILGEWSKRSTDLKEGNKDTNIKTRYISGESFFEATYNNYASPVIDQGIKKIDSNYIIGSLAKQRDVWIPESQQRDVISLIQPVIDTPSPQTFDELFFDRDGGEHIEVLKFSGPSVKKRSDASAEPERAIYFVQRGVERVAAARVIGIPVVARVKEMRMPTFVDPIYPATLSGDRHAAWNILTNGKLLETDITGDFNIKNGEPVIITMKQGILSWLPWFSLNATAQICQQYEALYPGVLDNLQTLDRRPIMKNALFTPQTLRSFLRKSS